MKLHRDIEVSQKTAWSMIYRLRNSFRDSGVEALLGLVEPDETYICEEEKNIHKHKKLGGRRGGVGKVVFVDHTG